MARRSGARRGRRVDRKTPGPPPLEQIPTVSARPIESGATGRPDPPRASLARWASRKLSNERLGAVLDAGRDAILHLSPGISRVRSARIRSFHIAGSRAPGPQPLCSVARGVVALHRLSQGPAIPFAPFSPVAVGVTVPVLVVTLSRVR
eukprot:gene3983-biopygen2321